MNTTQCVRRIWPRNRMYAGMVIFCFLVSSGMLLGDDAKLPSQWRLLAFLDFNDAKDTEENKYTMIGDNRVLSGFELRSQKLNIDVVDGAYEDLKVTFDFYFIDSWDDEFAFLEAQIFYTDGTATKNKVYWQEAGHSHFFPNNITGNTYRDYRTFVQVIIDDMEPGKSVSRLELTFKAVLDSSSLDETWAMDNLEIYGR